LFSLLKRHRELIIVAALLLYPGITYLTSGHRGREPNFIDRVVLAISSPIQRGLSWVFDGVGGGVSGYIALRGVYEENAKLRQENSQLRNDANALRETVAENERLRKLLGYAETSAEPDIAAAIVGINPVRDVISVRIDKGEENGVRARMPVVTKEGVVGQIQRAVDGWADVVLITDPTSKIGALVQRSRVRATVVGAGGGKPLSLQNVLRTDDVQDGDIIITSGTDGVFPKGLVLGRAAGVKRQSTGMFLQAEVAPEVELTRIEEVLVLPVLNRALLSPTGVPTAKDGTR
jgi:rod shape-determining protein MreC